MHGHVWMHLFHGMLFVLQALHVSWCVPCALMYTQMGGACLWLHAFCLCAALIIASTMLLLPSLRSQSQRRRRRTGTLTLPHPPPLHTHTHSYTHGCIHI